MASISSAIVTMGTVIMIYCSTLSLSDPSDESCLSSLYSSLSDPQQRLVNWTKPNFASPCNGLTSYIAGATCNNGRIFKLSLARLSLSGALSGALISNCTSLQSLDLSSNQISGPIPPQISSLRNLAVLNLSSNHLSGPIPPQLALCAYLNVIDLHSNSLSGQIPEQLGSLLRLSAFDVSYNELEGPVPVMLANKTASGGAGGPRFNASSFVGNKGLYGFPLPPAPRGRGLSVMAIVGIGFGSGMLSLAISFTAVCIWLRVTERGGGRAAAGAGDGEGKISHLMPDY